MNLTQNKLIAAGVKNLKQFGYPDVNKDNILTDAIYSRFLLSMLEDNKGHGVDADIDALIAQIETNKP
jgi:hypothetical protein